MTNAWDGWGPARRGVTLVEALVMLAILGMVIVLLFSQTYQSTRSEGKTTQEAQFAFQQALLYEHLSADLHSATSVQKSGAGWTIRRWVDRGTSAESIEVVYEVEEKSQRITRRAPGEPAQLFDFLKLVPERMKFRLELERVGEEPQ